ncbi:MAG: ribonuclease Z [Candidatus Woesearchaeota archaeon]
MQLAFLGTTCMTPTKERNHIATLLLYNEEGILVDCGEGTQRQLKLADIKITKVTRILISHWHGDHVLGLPGLIQSLGASDYNKVLHIYGPKGTHDRVEVMIKPYVFYSKVDFKVHDITEGIFLETEKFKIEARNLEHGIITLGYTFIEKDRRKINLTFTKKAGIPEGPLLGKLQDGKTITFKGSQISPEDATYTVKGKRVAFISDTMLCKGCYDLAKDSDLLVCEAAYASNLEEKATEYKHMTAKQAALIASQSNVKRLVLTHFSARYKDTSEIEEDAKTVFENVSCAFDLMKIKL